VAINITDVLSELDPDSSLGTIGRASGRASVTFRDGSAAADNTWTLNPASDLAGLTIAVAEGERFNLSGVATTNDGGNIATPPPQTIAVTVYGGAEQPTLLVPASCTVMGGEAAVAINITDVLSELDPDSSLG